MAAVTAVLAKYPGSVITSVTHPDTGLPSNGKGWLPTIKEVKDACNEAFEPMRQQELREKRIAEQLAARAAEDAAPKPTLEQLQAKYGKDWGLTPNPDRADKPTWKAPTKEELSAHYREYGLQFRPKQQDAAE